MNITFEQYLELQPDAAGLKPNQRLWNFLLISFLLHLIIIRLLIDYPSQSVIHTPYKVIPRLTININNENRVMPAEHDSIPVDETGPAEKPENIEKQVVPDTAPTIPPPEAIVILPARPETALMPEAKDLVEKSLAYAPQAAREIETRANPGTFMTNTDKDKLQMANIMLEQQDPEMDNPDKLLVYANQYGDLVYQTGDSCVAVPAVFVLYKLTRQLNSIMATPVSCGNSRKKNTFSLK